MTLAARVTDLAPYDLLLSVARLGSLGRAAAEHGLSQPAVSARMRLLERHLGLPLIERSPRGSRLTPAGALVADWAHAAVDAAAALDAGVTALRAERESRLRIAASLTVAEYLLPGWLSTLRRAEPEATVALTAVNSAEAAVAVLSGAAEIGFVEGPDVPAGLTATVAGRDTLTLVTAPSHPWARRRGGVTAAELAGTALVAREAASGTRRFLEQAIADQAGLTLAAPLAELSSTTAIKSAVAGGAGPAVLSSLALVGELAAGTLRVISVRDLDLHRALRAVRATGRHLTGPAASLHSIAARSARPAPSRPRGRTGPGAVPGPPPTPSSPGGAPS
jgi:DNA-binding transcriptional LysR family regulator